MAEEQKGSGVQRQGLLFINGRTELICPFLLYIMQKQEKGSGTEDKNYFTGK